MRTPLLPAAALAALAPAVPVAAAASSPWAGIFQVSTAGGPRPLLPAEPALVAGQVRLRVR